MAFELKTEDKFEYIDEGSGHAIILLHGLMGGLSNFDSVISHFSKAGYRVLAPSLPLYTLPLLKTTIRTFDQFLEEFIQFKGLDNYTLCGNSLGGHIALVHTLNYLDNVHSVVLTGSSGLYESAMGNSFPKRGNYEFIQAKTQEVFYNPEVATKELVDEVYSIVNDRNKVIKTLAVAKSAIRHNMSKDLPKLKRPFCLIWGKNDTVTPPEVAEEFHKTLPMNELHWIDKCGHAPMMEHPIIFNRIMDEWLSALKGIDK